MDKSSSSRHSPSKDGEFPRAVARAAVAQICEDAGFQAIQSSALECLADVAIRYLCEIGKTSQFYANLAGRTQSNALDVFSSVEHFHGGGLAEAHGAMANAGTFTELKRFVDCAKEIPFSKPVPHFPVSKKRQHIPTFSQLGEEPPYPHIPPWLPGFPDPYTYQVTPASNEKKTEFWVDELEQAKQRRKAEQSLASLRMRLCTSGASPSADYSLNSNGHTFALPQNLTLLQPPQDGNNHSKPELDSGVDKGKTNKRPVVSIQNPFLLPPLPPDAKEVSALDPNGAQPLFPDVHSQKLEGSLTLPSALDTFIPALDAATNDVQEKGGALTSSGGFLCSSQKRMPFLMTFDFGKRVSEKGVVASLSLGGKGKKKHGVEIKDEERDEKKKRVEQILAQS